MFKNVIFSFQWVWRCAALPRAAGSGAERVRRRWAAVAWGASTNSGDPRHASHSRHRRRLAARGTHLRGRWIHEHEREKVRFMAKLDDSYWETWVIETYEIEKCSPLLLRLGMRWKRKASTLEREWWIYYNLCTHLRYRTSSYNIY